MLTCIKSVYWHILTHLSRAHLQAAYMCLDHVNLYKICIGEGRGKRPPFAEKMVYLNRLTVGPILIKSYTPGKKLMYACSLSYKY